jgi:hypothetical protein
MRPYFLNVDKSERQNILDLHKQPYDGYVVRQETSNTQPLMVQDFANDKGGITVKSNGEVSEYNNKIYMRESSGECNECGDYKEEMDEIALEKLTKGKKYKYQKPNLDDELEFEDEVDFPSGEKMYSFGGKKDKGHLIGKYDIEKYLNEPEEMYEESSVCNECGMYEEICECGRGYMEESYDEEFFTNVEDPDNFISSGKYGEIDYEINSEDEISEPFVDNVEDDDNEGDIDLLMIFNDDEDPEFDREIDLGKPKLNSQVDKTLDMFKRFQKY